MIDISRSVTVSDFRRIRQSNILGVIHKASEGGDYADTAYGARRPQAEAAGLLWGAYHFGTCLLYTSPSPRDGLLSRMPSSA